MLRYSGLNADPKLLESFAVVRVQACIVTYVPGQMRLTDFCQILLSFIMCLPDCVAATAIAYEKRTTPQSAKY